MPLKRIWKALRWFSQRPPPAPLIRGYFGIKDPPPKGARPTEYSSEDEILGLGRALGMPKAG